jgi:hypothetical protein
MHNDCFEDFRGQSSNSSSGFRVYLLIKPQSNMKFLGKLFPL